MSACVNARRFSHGTVVFGGAVSRLARLALLAAVLLALAGGQAASAQIDETFNAPHLAASSGLVLASAYTGACRGPGSVYTYQYLRGYAGDNSSGLAATTPLAVEEDWGEWRALTITFPVKKGQYWQVNSYCAAAVRALHFIPTLTDDDIGAAAPVLFNQRQQAQQNGLVVGFAYTGACRGLGTPYTYQYLRAYKSAAAFSAVSQDLEYAVEEGWGEWRAVSIAFPVRAGEYYQVQRYCPFATSQLFFVPTTAAFSAAVDGSFNTAYQSSQAGLVTASGYTGACTGPGAGGVHQVLLAMTGSSKDDLKIRAVEDVPGEWRAASITFPVKAGDFWKVVAYCPPPYTGSSGAVGFLKYTAVTEE